MKMKLKMSLWICLFLLVVPAQLRAGVLASDNFENGVLDADQWIALDKNGAEVIEANGVLSLSTTDTTRPYLVTKDGWDTTTQGSLILTGTVTLPTTNSSFVICARSSGDYDSAGMPNVGGVIGGSLRVSCWLGGGANILSVMTKEDAVWPWVNMTTSAVVNKANLSPEAGDWDVLFVDDGISVMLTVTHVANPANTGSIFYATTFVPAVTNHKISLGNAGASWDNLTILTGENTQAWNPVPDSGAIDEALDVQLSWNTGVDPANPGQYNPAITSHLVYMTSGDENDPNFYLVSTIDAGAATGSYTPAGMTTDKTYYWRVDERLDNDPNDIKGEIWRFDTIKSIVLIDNQPTNAGVFPGETAQFTIGVSSLSPETYEWYLDDPNELLPDPKLSDLSDPDITGAQTATLSIANAELADEGNYYCIVTNGAGPVTSQSASLGIKQMEAFWTLDQAKYIDGLYQDETTNDRDASPTGTPVFVEGMDTNATGAAEIGTDYGWAAAGNWDFTEYTGQFSLTCWVKWTGGRGAIFAKRDAAWNDSSMLFQLTVEDDGRVLIDGVTGGKLYGPAVTVNTWTYVCVSYDGSKAQIFVDGVPSAAQAYTLGSGTATTNVIGALLSSGNVPFTGALDDMALYSYALTPQEIAALYYEATGIGICLDRPMMDVTGPDGEPDCLVTIHDLSVLASEWLSCGLAPIDACP